MEIDMKTKLLIVLVLSIALFSILFSYMNRNRGYDEIPYKLFLSHVEKGLVEEMELNEKPKLVGKLKSGKGFITDNPRTENFKEYLLLYDVKVIEGEEANILGQGISFILFLMGIGIVAYMINKNGSKQVERNGLYVRMDTKIAHQIELLLMM